MRPIRSRGVRPEDRKHRVLAIVGDTQVGLWVVRSMARNGLSVHAVVNSESGQSAYSRFTSSAWILESRPGHPGFAEEMEALVRRLDVGSIMPVSEAYHNALIDIRERFEPNVHLFSPSRESFDKATDKDYLQTLCVELGIPVAHGMRLDQILAEGRDRALRFPLVLRTRRQNVRGGKAPWKAAYADTLAVLERLSEQVKDFPENVIVQEYHPGVEDHVQILMHNGSLVMAGDYIGEHHMPLAGGVTVQRVSCHHEELVSDAVRLLKAIDYEGIAGVQFHYDSETGKYIFLEINPRFSGGLPTVIMAGFEASFRLWQSHFEPERMQKDTYRLGLRTRILGGDANWLLGMMREDPLPPGQKHLGKLRAAATFLWHTGPWTRDDSFLWSDPVPFLVDVRQMVKKLGARAMDIVGNEEP
ncbi:MAG: ATP-grasp domain-containing protein [Desulfobacteraceae bacterium]